MIALRKFSQIKIPPLDQIASVIRVKNISLILQNKNFSDKTDNNYKQGETKISFNDNNIPIPVNKYKYSSDRRKTILFNGISFDSNDDSFEEKHDIIEHKFSNGILYENTLRTQDLYEKKWSYLIKRAQVDKRKEKTFKSGFQPLFNLNKGFAPENQYLPVYKLNCYDEKQ